LCVVLFINVDILKVPEVAMCYHIDGIVQ